MNTDITTGEFLNLSEETLEAGNKLVKYFTSDKLLIIYRISKGKNYDTENQLELPRAGRKRVATVV